MKKKIIIITVIILLIAAIIGGLFVAKNLLSGKTEEKKTTGVEWGDLYYDFFKDQYNDEELKNKKLQFIQLDENQKPAMLFSYEDAKNKILKILVIDSENKVKTKSFETEKDNELDVKMLYNVKEEKYNWYEHEKKADESEVFTRLDSKDIEEEKEITEDKIFEFTKEEMTEKEETQGELPSISKFNETFIDTEKTADNQTEVENMDKDELVEKLKEAIEKYKDNSELVEELKDKIEEKLKELETKKEEIEKEKAKIEEKKAALEQYLGKDINKTGSELSLKNAGASAGTEYSNEEVIMSSDFGKDSINYILLQKGETYTLYGVKIGMSFSEANKALESNGYMADHSGNNNSYYYIDSNGSSNITLICDSSDNVKSISVTKF